MLEVSSSDWAWHGGPWGSFFSCQAEISSLPLSVPSTVQKHCVFTGKMPKMFWKGSGGGLQTLQGSTGASLSKADGGGSFRDASLTLATPLCFILCHGE